MDYLSSALLAYAALHRFRGDFARAERDLSETLRIVTHGSMGLHRADYHLDSARLQLAQGNQEKASENLSTAREMIERMGNHRRDCEVIELEKQLATQ